MWFKICFEPRETKILIILDLEGQAEDDMGVVRRERSAEPDSL